MLFAATTHRLHLTSLLRLIPQSSHELRCSKHASFTLHHGAAKFPLNDGKIVESHRQFEASMKWSQVSSTTSPHPSIV